MGLSQPNRTLIIFGVVHLFIFSLFTVLAQHFYPDPGGLEHLMSLRMLEGQIPYRDFVSEYPPLALLSFLVPGLVFRTPLAYHWAFATELLIFDIVALVLIASLAPLAKISRRKSLIVYTLLILVIGPLIIIRYDLLPAVLVLLALFTFINGRTKTAWAVLALGFTAKLYPVIVAPLFVIYHLRHQQYGRLWKGGLVFLAVLLVLTGPWIIIDAPAYWSSLTYHLERGLHSESSYGTLLLVGQVLGMTKVEGELTFGSWNLSSPLADRLAGISLYASSGFLLVVYCLFGWQIWKRSKGGPETRLSETPAAARLLQYASLAVIVFLLTNKVFSPQFLIWLCPLLPLTAGRWRYIPWLLFLAAGGLTLYVFPGHYVEFELFEPYLVGMLAGRNLLLASAAILMALSPRSTPEVVERGYPSGSPLDIQGGG